MLINNFRRWSDSFTSVSNPTDRKYRPIQVWTLAPPLFPIREHVAPLAIFGDSQIQADRNHRLTGFLEDGKGLILLHKDLLPTEFQPRQ